MSAGPCRPGFLVRFFNVVPSLCLLCCTGYFSIILMWVTALTMFGLNAVAREIQDPFGFDENDLNIQGYENMLIDDLDTMLDGHVRPRPLSRLG